MATTVLLLELAVVLAMIFIGARMGGIGLGIFGMLGVFVLVYGFGLKPGSAPIDVMMIILAVVTAAAALQAAGGLEYLVGQAAIFLRKHPHHITYYGPLCTWLFCLVAGTAHTCYSLLPIISEIAQANKIRPERPLSLAVISASLGITGSPVSAATAAIISQDLLGGAGVELGTILMVCVPASLVAILVAAFIQNRVGKALEDDPEYQRRVREGLICPEKDTESLRQAETMARPEAKYSVWVFLFGVALVVLFGFQPQLRPEGVTMSETIEMIMMADVILIMLVGSLLLQPPDSLTALALAAIIIGVQQPFAPCDIGFQLSVCGVLGVLAASALAKRQTQFVQVHYAARHNQRRQTALPLPLAIVLRAVDAVQTAGLATLATLPV